MFFSSKSECPTFSSKVRLNATQLTMARLMRNASRKARASGEKRIAARDIRKVTMVSDVASSGPSAG